MTSPLASYYDMSRMSTEGYIFIDERFYDVCLGRAKSEMTNGVPMIKMAPKALSKCHITAMKALMLAARQANPRNGKYDLKYT